MGRHVVQVQVNELFACFALAFPSRCRSRCAATLWNAASESLRNFTEDRVFGLVALQIPQQTVQETDLTPRQLTSVEVIQQAIMRRASSFHDYRCSRRCRSRVNLEPCRRSSLPIRRDWFELRICLASAISRTTYWYSRRAPCGHEVPSLALMRNIPIFRRSCRRVKTTISTHVLTTAAPKDYSRVSRARWTIPEPCGLREFRRTRVGLRGSQAQRRTSQMRDCEASLSFPRSFVLTRGPVYLCCCQVPLARWGCASSPTSSRDRSFPALSDEADYRRV